MDQSTSTATHTIPELPGRRLLGRWYDPEWPLFALCLLLPALGALCAGSGQSARFFFGLAVYAAMLKWIGWAVLGRWCSGPTRYALYPAEIFAGMAVVTAWFYVRNAVGYFWPTGYGLWELPCLTVAVFAFHAAATTFHVVELFRSRVSIGQLVRTAGSRLAVYLAYVLGLTVTFVLVSRSYSVQAYDPIHHAFSARVYLHEGVWFSVFNGGWPILYPTGYGAINATAAALAPWSVVQVVNAQHAFMLLTAVFLFPAVLSWLRGGSLGLLFWMALALVFEYGVCVPVWASAYEGTGRAAAPALFLAIAMLPLLVRGEKFSPLIAAILIVAMLSVLAVAINPACAPLVFLANAVAAVIFAAKRRTALASRTEANGAGGRAWLRRLGIFGLQVVATGLLGTLVVFTDPYYARILADGKATHGPDQELKQGGLQFDAEQAWAKLDAAANGRGFADQSLESGTRGMVRAYVLQAWWAGLGLLALMAAVPAIRRAEGFTRVFKFSAGLLASFYLAKFGSIFIAEGIERELSWEADLLARYVETLLWRSEPLLAVGGLLSVFAGLYAAAGASGARVLRWIAIGLGMLLLLAWVGYLVDGAMPTVDRVISFLRGERGPMPLEPAPDRKPLIPGNESLAISLPNTADDDPTYPYTRITLDDLELLAWIERHIPPECGLIGLMVVPFKGNNTTEKHIYPLTGSQVLILYGSRYQFCFANLDPSRRYGWDDYRERVHPRFDARWCLDQNIRFFYVTETALNHVRDLESGNVLGLERAIRRNELRLLHSVGGSAIYEVLPPE